MAMEWPRLKGNGIRVRKEENAMELMKWKEDRKRWEEERNNVYIVVISFYRYIVALLEVRLTVVLFSEYMVSKILRVL